MIYLSGRPPHSQCDRTTHKYKMSETKPLAQKSKKLWFTFLFVEFCVFASQVLVIFIVSYFISDSLGNEERLTKFVLGKVNTETMSELGLTLFATTFVLGLLSLIKEVSSSPLVEKITGEILSELPRTIYLFGSSITAATVAIAVFLSTHPEAANKPASGFFALSAGFAITFFAYGCGAKALLVAKK
jgi:hypothetical protein